MSKFFEDLARKDEAVQVFTALKPAEKKLHIDKLYEGAMHVFDEAVKNSPRRGQTQGSAFLWLDLWGKTTLDRAFRKKVKDRSQRPIMQNYRGAANAWYFGSQNDLAYFDGLVAMSSFLYVHGVSASQCDEWD